MIKTFGLNPYPLGGTGQAYSFVDFNREGTLLASVGSAPDYMLTLWEWRHEQVMLRCKAFSQDVYRVTFSPDNPGQLTTSGSGHIKLVAINRAKCIRTTTFIHLSPSTL